MASSPSPASPTTAMSGASSRMRRKPRRTRLWSSTSKTLILSGMRLRFFQRNLQPDQCAAFRWSKEFQATPKQFGAFPHGYQPNARFRALRAEPGAVILDLQFQRLGEESQAHPGLAGTGMT